MGPLRKIIDYFSKPTSDINSEIATDHYSGRDTFHNVTAGGDIVSGTKSTISSNHTTGIVIGIASTALLVGAYVYRKEITEYISSKVKDAEQTHQP